MAAVPKEKLNVSEFLSWATEQENGRYELLRGEVIAMAPERVRHTVVKGNIYRLLSDAIRKAGLSCTAFADGVTVVIDDTTSFEPDVTMVCNSDVDLDAVTVDKPLLAVEVTSPSSEKNDTTGKLADYLTLPSIQHVVIVDPLRKLVMHHAKQDGPDVLTRILREGDTLNLDPPGIALGINGFFDET